MCIRDSSIEALHEELKLISKEKELKPNKLAKLLLQPNERVKEKIDEIFDRMAALIDLETEVAKKIFDTVIFWLTGVISFYVLQCKIALDYNDLRDKLLQCEEFNEMLNDVIINLYFMFILAYLMVCHMLLEPFVTSREYNVRYNLTDIRDNDAIMYLVRKIVAYIDESQLVTVIYAFITGDLDKYERAKEIYEVLKRSLIAHVEVCLKIALKGS